MPKTYSDEEKEKIINSLKYHANLLMQKKRCEKNNGR